MKPVQSAIGGGNIQRHVSNLGSNNPITSMNPLMQQKPLGMNMNPTVQPVFYVPPSTGTQMPVFNSFTPYNLQMPQMTPFMQYPYGSQQPIYYYQMPAQMPRSTPILIRSLNTNRSFGPDIRLPPPIPIDNKEYEPPKTYPLALPPPIAESPDSNIDSDMPTMIYKYKKPVVVVDSLKHPRDKYKDLIYRPKYLTSRNIDPPTEELVPKLDDVPPLPSLRNASKINIDIHVRYPTIKSSFENLKLTSRNPTLVGELKLPHSKVSLRLP